MPDAPQEQSTETADIQADTLPATEEASGNKIPTPSKPDRRTLLKRLTTVSAVTAFVAPSSSAKPDTHKEALSSPQTDSALGQRPDLPPLATIAFNRMAFGPRPDGIERFHRLGNSDDNRLTAYVEEQLHPDDIDEHVCDEKLAEEEFRTLNLPLRRVWRTYINGQGMMGQEVDRRDPAHEVERMTFLRAVYSECQLVEVLTDHWHNHFNVYGWDNWTAPFFAFHDQQVIRPHVLGNFRLMLEAVTQSPAMLYYLDNQSNEGGDPNENFARELFEIHTLGASNYLGVRGLDDPTIIGADGERLGYIDEDIYGATLCFTGWHVKEGTGEFFFDEGKHFPFQKVVMGQSLSSFRGIDDGHAVLDLLASHPGTAYHVSYKLCQRLISDHPPANIVEAATKVFQQAAREPDQLKQVVRTILLSDEFRTTWGQKVKRPFEYAVSLLRATGADFVPSDQYLWMYNAGGQELFGWHPPNGYPDVQGAWLGTMSMLHRWRLANQLLDWQYNEDHPRAGQHRLALRHPRTDMASTPEQIVDWWSNRLLGYILPPNERNQVVEFMAAGRNPTFDLPREDINKRLRHMVGLIFMSPSFLWR
ncbi:MAG: DUF1800 domain-containing protein [Chloroflexota bacterium]